jgi:hypothetical protein
MANGDDPIPIHTVLLEEFNHQHPDQAIDGAAVEARRAYWEQRFAGVPDEKDRARSVESGLVGEVYRLMRAAAARDPRLERTALCLSGGGIRSATFGLGVVQGMARRKLLQSFSFLSTVSGGGYMGGWLSGWIAREPGGVEAVEKALAEMPQTPLEPDPEPVHHLRSYSRYMSPRFGLLSADTWTLVAIFFRNLLLNWLVLVPLLAAALLLPRLGAALARLAPARGTQQAVLWFALAAGILAIAFIIANRPSLNVAHGSKRALSRWPRRLQGQGAFLGLCLLPLACMAIGITLVWYWMERGIATEGLRIEVLGWSFGPWAAWLLFGVALHVGGFVLSRLWVRSLSLFELLGVVISGALGGLLVAAAASLASGNPGFLASDLGREIYVCCAAPLLLVLFLLAVALFIALTSKWSSDDDREWLARAAGWILIWVVSRAFLSALVMFGPVLWLDVGRWTTGVVGGVSGLLTLLLGFGSNTGANKEQANAPRPLSEKVSGAVLALAAPLFALSLLVGMSALTSFGLSYLVRALDGPLPPGVGLQAEGFLNVVARTPVGVLLAAGLALAVFGLIAGYFVDINQFSLHGAYRDRLIRAYLGASRQPGTRRPNLFTGFDRHDNLEMVDLAANRPFHLVNVALNLVHGTDLAWQDRKAESFTFSALHCGYRGGYRSSDRYGRRLGGERISLGTAVAISGAAASPNMGSNSSPVITFLLALFNVRLGWWLGNPGPAGAATYTTQGPREASAALAAEAFGLTNDQNPYIYLSDGGHFENLGLYEMVLRRCRLIVVSDGSQDPEFQYEDLGNAISKIRIDLGVPIEFHSLPMRARPDLLGKTYDPAPDKAAFPYFAVARIRYSCVDGLPDAAEIAQRHHEGDPADLVDGWLLYFKPSLNGTEPADIFHYAKIHPDFPHESTGNQLYSEVQFESYRALGSWAVETLPKAAQGSLQALFAALPGCPP